MSVSRLRQPATPPPLPKRARPIRVTKTSDSTKRAWVDHRRLGQIHPESTSWRATMVSLGLTKISPKDPECPPALRKLLQCHEDTLELATMVGLWCIVYASLSSGIATATESLAQGLALAWLPSFGIAILSSWVSRSLVFPTLEQWLGGPLPGRPLYNRDTALSALASNPFVVLMGDTLVENVPSSQVLKDWRRQMDYAAQDVARRERQVRDLIERLTGWSYELAYDEEEPSEEDSEDFPFEDDPHIAGLQEVLQKDEALIDRIRLTQAEIDYKIRRIEKSLSTLRRRADEERTSRQQQGGPRRRLAVAVERDLDVDAIGALVDSLHDEVKEGKRRAFRVSEQSIQYFEPDES